jgi:hypothetical protein
MKRLRLDGPRRTRLLEGGRVYEIGDEFEVTGDRAKELLADPSLVLVVVKTQRKDTQDEPAESGTNEGGMTDGTI